MSNDIRYNWTLEEIQDIYNMPLLELVFRAAELHRKYNDTAEVQVCTLLSIKTGGCSEDCAYCPQAARYNTGIDVQALMKKEEVLSYAQKAKDAGSTRFCMGAAWREVRDNRDFDRVLDGKGKISFLYIVSCILALAFFPPCDVSMCLSCSSHSQLVHDSTIKTVRVLSTRPRPSIFRSNPTLQM